MLHREQRSLDWTTLWNSSFNSSSKLNLKYALFSLESKKKICKGYWNPKRKFGAGGGGGGGVNTHFLETIKYQLF